MEGYTILMLIFGACIFLYGLDIMFSKNPVIPKLHVKKSRAYYKFVGKTTMLISLSPVFASLIPYICKGNLFFTIIYIVLIIIYIIFIFYICNKKWNPDK